MLNWMIELHVH